MTRKVVRMVVSMFVLLQFSACAPSRSGRLYSPQDALRSMKYEYGTVLSVKPAVIDGEQTSKSTLAGPILGAALGYGAGGGSYRAAAAAAGGVAGLIIAPLVEQHLNRRSALEIEVALDDGHRVLVLQEDDVAFLPGERVRVITSSCGEMRIRPMATDSLSPRPVQIY